MLVLSRLIDQDIVIQTSDGPITIRVVDVRKCHATTGYKGPQVRLGFEAPGNVTILRRELIGRGEG